MGPAHHVGGRESFRTYMDEKRRKLRQVEEEGCRSGGPLGGVRIHVNGYTEPSREDLRSLVLKGGGGFEAYWSDRATHMVCSKLCEATRRRLGHDRRPVVRPEWVVDSVAAGKLLQVCSYLIERDAPAGPGPRQQRLHGARARSPGLREALDTAAEARGRCKVLQRGTMSTREDPDYVKHFFEASRLSFIGSWQDRWEALLRSLPEGASRPSLEPTDSGRGAGRSIIHVDMDCYFASVATLQNPAARGRPLAVSHSGAAGSGEIASANYEARAFGLRAGMRMDEARGLCPDLVVMPYTFDAYERVSEEIYRVFLRHSSCVKPVSCDEAYLDVSGLGDPVRIAADIRAEIARATGCTASAGISSNMLLARLATAQAKPDGQRELTFLQGRALLEHLPVRELPGVGWKAREKFSELGVKTCGELRRLEEKILEQKFGPKMGDTLYQRAQGMDGEPVALAPRKSITVEISYGVRLDTKVDVENFVSDLSTELSKKVRNRGSQGGFKLTVKVKRKKENAPSPRKHLGHGPCIDLSRSLRRQAPLGIDHKKVSEEAMALIISLYDTKKLQAQEIRGVGITLDNLAEEELKSSPNRPKEKDSLPLMLHKLARPLAFSPPRAFRLPSFSQINPEVLEAMPPDVLRSLEEDYGTTLAGKKLPVRGAALCFEPQKRASETPRRRPGVEESGILTITQCDPDVLAELGPELLAEIRKTYFHTRDDLPKQDFHGLDARSTRLQGRAGPSSDLNSTLENDKLPPPPSFQERLRNSSSVAQFLDTLNGCLVKDPTSFQVSTSSSLIASILEYLNSLVECRPTHLRKALRWIQRSARTGNSPALGQFPGGALVNTDAWQNSALHIVQEVQVKVVEVWGAPLRLEDAVLPPKPAVPPPETAS